MRTPRNTLSVELLRESLKYDPETGDFFWISSKRKKWAGKKTGYIRKDGYIIINIGGQICLAHRLAWLHFYGQWPTSGIDHINGDPSDNRMCNLREARPDENHWNMKMFATNTSGYRGVSLHRKTGKWAAEIWFKRKKFYLGLFETKELASRAVESARSKMFGEFNRTSGNKP